MYLSDPFTRHGWDPFREMERVLDDMNRLVARTRDGGLAADEAAANVWASDDQVVITLAAPGLDPQAIEATAVGETVTIRAKARAEAGDGQWLRREREGGDVTRTFQLPFAVDADRAEAQYRNGILALRLHRPEADKPRRIAVSAS